MLSIVMPPFLLFCRWEDTDKDNGGWREIQSLSAAVPDCSRRTSTTSSCRGCRPAPSHYLLIQCKSSEINAWPKVSNSICGPKKILLAGESSIRKRCHKCFCWHLFCCPADEGKTCWMLVGRLVTSPGRECRSAPSKSQEDCRSESLSAASTRDAAQAADTSKALAVLQCVSLGYIHLQENIVHKARRIIRCVKWKSIVGPTASVWVAAAWVDRCEAAR